VPLGPGAWSRKGEAVAIEVTKLATAAAQKEHCTRRTHRSPPEWTLATRRFIVSPCNP
jgi:hypothetical protein